MYTCAAIFVIEYDALTRLGIDDPKGYITSRYSRHGDIIQLQTCCVGQVVLTEIEAALDEIQSSGGWLDAMVRERGSMRMA